MSYYRLYFMDPRTGHILRFTEFEASDDKTATALARKHEGDQPLELWCEHRKVARFERADRDPMSTAQWRGRPQIFSGSRA